MKIEEHFKNKVSATKAIRERSDRIKKLADNIKTAKDVVEFTSGISALKSLSLKNFEECSKLLEE